MPDNWPSGAALTSSVAAAIINDRARDRLGRGFNFDRSKLRRFLERPIYHTACVILTGVCALLSRISFL